MIKIEKEINKLAPDFKGLRIVKGIPIVDAIFKDGWIVKPTDGVGYKNSDTVYVFFVEEEGTSEGHIDLLLNTISGIIDFNIEREKKQELFKRKLDSLKEMFSEHDLNDLEKLEMKITKEEETFDVIKPNKRNGKVVEKVDG
jgi:hypothetical protein